MEKQQQTICLWQRKPRQPQPPERGEHPREHPREERGAEALPGLGPRWGSDTSLDEPAGIPLPSPTLIPGDPPFLPGVAFLGALGAACIPSLPAKPPPAQLIDEWALDMIDLFDGVKRGDYLVLVDFSKCISRRHRTFLPLSLLTPLLATNLRKDLASPV